MAESVSGFGFRQRFFAWMLSHVSASYEKAGAEKKRALLSGLSGTVVEIGLGTGANLKYYPRGVCLIGVEPNPHMDTYIAVEAKRHGISLDLRRGTAEAMPLEDASADYVVSTLVLCSVEDQGAVLREVLRVLKPGGRFVWLEHVAAPAGTRKRWWQDFLVPIWRRVGDGCHPNRETWHAIEGAGFADVRLEHFEMPMGLVGPHIAGSAAKADG